MPRSNYLPDISGRFNQWTNYAINSIKEKQYLKAYGALNNMNALLDEEHRIKVDTAEYNLLLKTSTLYTCRHCSMDEKVIVNVGEEDQRTDIVKVPREVKKSNVTFYDLVPPYLESIFTKKLIVKAWTCPECHNTNRLANTKIIKIENESPYYLRCVPEMPTRKGMLTRYAYDDVFTKYFNNYFEELESTMMQYRVDYKALNGSEMTELFIDKGDAG